MTFTPIDVREDPPMARGGQVGEDGRVDWSGVVAALRENPGAWVLFEAFQQTERINSLYRTVARQGAVALRLEGERVEARVRNSTRSEGSAAPTRRRGDLYLRIVNTEED